MFIRCIMIVLLLIATAMPAWANAKEPNLSPEVKQLMEAGIDLYEEEVLKSLQIDVQDQLEDDIYNIILTITNPTNTPLNKKIALTTITYDACHADDPYQTITQYTDAIPAFVIEPGETYTTTIKLKQPVPAQFNQLDSCAFIFEDNTTLHYNTLSESAPTSPFRLIPTVSPFGDVSLQIQNSSAAETITELRDIRLNFTVGEESHKMLLPDLTTLQLKPGEAHTIPLFTLASASNTKSSGFSLGANTVSTSRSYNYHINMKINGIPHTYYDNYSDATQISGVLKTTRIDQSSAEYHYPAEKLDPKNGAFYLDGTDLNAYLNVKNISETTFASAKAAYRLTLSYFDQNSLYQEKHYIVHLPQDFSIAPHKSKYYAFKLPLPADFKKLHAYKGLSFQSLTSRSLANAKLAQVASTSDIPKKDYIPLTNIELEK